MPRKKLEPNLDETTSPTPQKPAVRKRKTSETPGLFALSEAPAPSQETPAESKPRRGRPRKVVEPIAAAPSPVAEEEAPKPRRGRRPKAISEPLPVEAVEPAPLEPVAEPTEVKPRRGRPRKITAPVPELSTEAQIEAPAQPAAPKPRRNRRSVSIPVTEALTESEVIEETSIRTQGAAKTGSKPARARRIIRIPDDLGFESEDEAGDDDLPIPSWRPVQRVAGAKGGRRRGRGEKDRGTDSENLEAVSETPGEDLDSEADEPRNGRRRRRGRGGRSGEEETVRSRVAIPEPVPASIAKPPIPIPDDAPQVVLRGGVPNLVRNGRVYPPLFFFGKATDPRGIQTVTDEMRMAKGAGVHLHSLLIELEVTPQGVVGAASLAEQLLGIAAQVDPEAQVLFRVVFLAPSNWTKEYPRSVYRTRSGMAAEPSLCDDAFWSEAERCLTEFIAQIRKSPQSEHLLGVHLERGEWFLPEGDGYDTSEAAKEKFREWTRHRYQHDEVMLRAAWFDGRIRFSTVEIPEFAPEGSDGEKFVRSSRKQRCTVDYHLFLSDATVARIADLAYAAKKASEGSFLVGVSYGYTFEWSHPSSGHLSLGKLLRSPEIDFIAGPPSYKNREPGGSAPMPCPVDSFALNGKLYLSEEDFKTSIGERRHEPDEFNPELRTPQALESVHWRGLGAALAHGSGVCWMDLWGNGWLKSPGIWARAEKAIQNLIYRIDAPLQAPDVAVFIDERALAYLVDQDAFKLVVQNVRESVMRSGLSAGFYLLSDLAHRETFPESKLYLFLNAWDLRPEQRAAIKSRLQKDGKVLFWLYTAGLFESGRESLERAREVTGIALRPQPFNSRSGTTLLNRRHPLVEAFNESGLTGSSQLEPSYFGIPEDAVVLGEYSQTGLPSFLVRETKGDNPGEHWTSIFLGEPVVNPALVRAMGQMAGAHVWNFQEDVVHVRMPFLTVHCAGAGPRALALPDKFSAYDLIRGEWAAVEATKLTFEASAGSTHLFLVGIKEELETLLRQNPDDVLRLQDLPSKPENTVRFDSLAFDVPIMKLGEFMEGGLSDEAAEDWLLRPRLVEQEEESAESESESEKVGRRRRRRRGGRGRDRDGQSRELQQGSEETASRRPEGVEIELAEEGLEMSVVFRKRS